MVNDDVDLLEEIDSKCHGNPIDADAAVDNWCGNDASTFVFKPAGHRVYVCLEHAEQVIRFGDEAFRGTHPTVVVCKRCQKYTPKDRVNFEKICEDCQAD
jgi:hypothetical protein